MKAQFGRVPTPPTEYEVRKFLDFVNETGAPEKYPLISHTRPPLGKQHELCCSIYVPRRKRPNEELIPCSLCDDRPKFLDGHLLWSEDGKLRLVGNTCGPKHFGEREYRRLLEEVESRRSLIACEEYLLSTLPEASVMLTKLERFASSVRRFQVVSRALRQRVPEMCRELWRIHTHEQDQLTVIRRSSMETAHRIRSSFGSASEYGIFRLGYLRGAHLFHPSFNPEHALKSHLQQLQTLRFENPLDALCEMADTEKLLATRNMQRTRDGVVRLHEKIAALPLFLSKESLSDLRRWFSDADCPIQLRVEIYSRSVKFYANRTRYVEVDLGPQNDVPSLNDF